MNQNILLDLQKVVKGEINSDQETLAKFSHDASIFEINPSVVVSPVDQSDVENVVNFVSTHKKDKPELSITARSAGTDMSGGALSESIVLSFTPHFNKTFEVSSASARVEPGVYYRDFEKISLEKGVIFPAYPASREICAFGGMISNNCGGEKSLEYGKAERYVEKLKVVLADAKTYEFSKITEEELMVKIKQTDFEGDVYRNIYKLITENYDSIMLAKPKVSKNSAGYALWNVYDKTAKTFDLTKLFIGSQGTLGVITEATVKLVPVKKYSEMMVVYLYEKDLQKLGEIINTVLATNPESFETYDDNTLRLAIKYFSEFQKSLGTTNIISTALSFWPEFVLKFTNKIPKLVLQIEFTGNEVDDLKNRITQLISALIPFGLVTKAVGDENKAKKYWLIRRQSFKLLKEKIKDKYASAFIDDVVVNPEYLSQFLPRFNQLISKYPSIIATTAGHIGEGNFHIIPLVDLNNENDRKIIPTLSKEVYDLVFEYHGTTNGEHNDGLIRTPYVKSMFGEQIYNLFIETKKIFDPNNIFNPGKKVEASMEYSMGHIRRTW